MNPNAVWSAPVRFAEVDAQGIVFNAHYLTYCDEAATAFLRSRSTPDLDLLGYADDIRVVSSTLSWTAPARWGDVVEVDAQCVRVGTTSFGLSFRIRVGEHVCAVVESTYVRIIDGRPAAVSDEVRAALS
jgi:acyl-CoA thioester hydrolase